MRWSCVALALFVVGHLRGEDSPLLTAAREREAKARAFEVSWHFEEYLQGVEVYGRQSGRRDFSLSGRGKLAVDGSKWWFEADVPSHIRSQWQEGAYDGSDTFWTSRSEMLYGTPEPVEEVTRNLFPANAQFVWPNLSLPLLWVFRGTYPESVFAPVPGYTDWEVTDGPEQQIGGRWCHEYRRRPSPELWERVRNRFEPMALTAQHLWVDSAAGNLPVRYQVDDKTVDLEYAPHPTLGWVPTGWTETQGRPPFLTISSRTLVVDTFELRDDIPAERFRHHYPVGSRVRHLEHHPGGSVHVTEMVVGEDGSFTPAPTEPDTPPDQLERPTLNESLWVVGVAVVGFVGFVAIVKWLSRRPPDPRPGRG